MEYIVLGRHYIVWYSHFDTPDNNRDVLLGRVLKTRKSRQPVSSLIRACSIVTQE